jgi:tRNA G18 (ribose-2'-O)-methylase SpoU
MIISVDEAGPGLLQALAGLQGRRGIFPGPEGSLAFLCEGRILVEKAIEEMAAGRLRVQMVLGSQACLEKIAETSPASLLLVVGESDFITQLAGFTFHRGALAWVDLPAPPPRSELFAAKRLLVLPQLVDIENLGLLLRSAAALGMDAVLYGKGPEVFDRRSVRVSMGACWKIPVYRSDDPLADLMQWRQGGGKVFAAALKPDSLSSYTWGPDGRCALILGQEGPGLPEEWLLVADHTLMIPMARDIDSLNVAAAGAILMHQLVSRNCVESSAGS